jgi:hypothetical protein
MARQCGGVRMRWHHSGVEPEGEDGKRRKKGGAGGIFM